MRTFLNLMLDLSSPFYVAILHFFWEGKLETFMLLKKSPTQSETCGMKFWIDTIYCCAFGSLLAVLRNGDLNEFWLNWGDADAQKTKPNISIFALSAPLCTCAAQGMAIMCFLPSRCRATHAWQMKRMHSDAWSRTADVLQKMIQMHGCLRLLFFLLHFETFHHVSFAYVKVMFFHPQHGVPKLRTTRTIFAPKDTEVLCVWTARQTILPTENAVNNATMQRCFQVWKT